MFLPLQLSRFKFLFSLVGLAFVFSANQVSAQSGNTRQAQPTPTPPEQVERVATEEIRVNISAFDTNGRFVPDLRVEDLVINEDGRLHQATSVRRTPANVLILLDVGGEIAYAKRRAATSAAAKGLVSALRETDSIAVMQYGDKVDVLSDWTQDKAAVLDALNDKKLGFGKRSAFNLALTQAVDFFRKSPLENRHLVLISDGVDTFDDLRSRNSAVRNLLSSDINVHVISYTKLQQNAITLPKTASGRVSRPKANNLPPGAELPVHGTTPTYTIATINLDRAMIRKRQEQIARLKTSEQFLSTIAEDTNGEIFLPETVEEMVDKTAQLAKNIDSQYVVTYTPNRPLGEADDGEERVIQVSSRRGGIDVQGRRKLIVIPGNARKP
ncbi:MAG TPA: VWA domain-containing protein [Pyrinomonadaceae bacterium]|nr:VWA domain-containing protein [Pyrinomonadaceae bacterium]